MTVSNDATSKEGPPPPEDGDPSPKPVQGGKAAETPSHGLTMWDFLAHTVWGRGFGCAVLVIVGVAAGRVLWLVDGTDRAVKIGFNGTTLEISADDSGTRSMLLVHPYGWQSTNMSVRKGEKIKFAASGRVSVGYLEHLWHLAGVRAQGPCVGPAQGETDLVPLAGCVFGPARDLKPHKWRFRGPDGFDPGPKERAGLLFPGAGFGELVGVVLPSGNRPLAEALNATEAKNAFAIGSGADIRIPDAGVLWLAVNDSPDYVGDNVGQFLVTAARTKTGE